MDISDLSGKKIAVTGATGFIGSRLVETLLLNKVDCKISVLIRNYSSLAHLARFDSIDYTFGNIDDNEVIDKFVKDADYVVHLAYDPSSQKTNINSIRNLSESCIKYEKKLIHTSTISVYEPLTVKMITEETEYDGSIFEYGKRKRLIEEEVLRYVEKGLDAVILQPTIVYGPYSGPWTDRTCYQLLTGTVVLPDGGSGICNPVYVYDVVRAIICALLTPKSNSVRFLISGPDSVTWGKYYNAFEKIRGTSSVINKNVKDIKNSQFNPVKSLRLILGDPKRAFSWEPMKSFLQSIKYKIPGKYRTLIKNIYGSYQKIAPKPIYMPNKQMLLLLTTNSVVDISRSQKELGYNPQYTFEDGMKKTAGYIKWAFPKSFDIQ